MLRRGLLLAAAVGSAVLGTAVPASAAPSDPGLAHRHAARVCSAPAPGSAACNSEVIVDDNGKPVTAASAPATGSFGPSDIRSAYKLTGLNSGGRTVAVVDAYNNPNAESNLATYRSYYGLSSCTSANGCFRKVSQTGSTRSLPPNNSSWGLEISLDLDAVSAACPDCKILLVEARSASFSDLATAVNYAAKQPGVVAITNSYGGSELNNSTIAAAYNHSGIAVTASTGDNGYGVQSPASYNTVVAVGGTSLTRSSTARGWTETAWSGAGSGCSAYNATTVQNTQATGCRPRKANADVSAVADPKTGLAVYDTYGYSGWVTVGGTSASSPIVAGVYALSGRTAGYPASYAWGNPSALNDVTSGSNGSCATTAWCTAGPGWDGPTGLGTPNGTAAF